MTALRWLTFACSLSGLIGCGDRGEAVTPTDAAAAKQPAQTARIRGHLLGSDGQPVAHAEVHVNEIGRPEYSVRVKDDGEFAIGLPDAGWVRLRLTGVDHADHTIGLLAEPGEHELTVRLGTYPRPAKFESVAGFGQFHGAGPTEAPAGQQRVNLVFHPRDDGKWVAKLARGDAGAGAQTFHYQIRDATSVAHTINGTQSDHYVYDGGGDYFSVLELGETDPIEIVWDPASLPPAGRELELRFVDPDTLVARSAQLGETIAKQRNEIMRSAAKRVDADTDTETRELELVRARAQVRERFADKAAAESTPALAGMWWIGWLEMLEFEPSDADRAAYQAQAKQVLELLGPRNPVWSMNEGWAMATALRYVDDPQFFSLAVAEHPDPTVGAALWLSTLMAADESGDLESGREATRRWPTHGSPSSTWSGSPGCTAPIARLRQAARSPTSTCARPTGRPSTAPRACSGGPTCSTSGRRGAALAWPRCRACMPRMPSSTVRPRPPRSS